MNPCPFFGSDRISSVFDAELFGHAMSCENCFARGPVFGTEQEAKVEWNNRAEHFWIPVEERLPKEMCEVVVRFRNYSYHGIGALVFGDWFSRDRKAKVTHWMPLPNPPKWVKQ